MGLLPNVDDLTAQIAGLRQDLARYVPELIYQGDRIGQVAPTAVAAAQALARAIGELAEVRHEIAVANDLYPQLLTELNHRLEDIASILGTVSKTSGGIAVVGKILNAVEQLTRKREERA